MKSTVSKSSTKSPAKMTKEQLKAAIAQSVNQFKKGPHQSVEHVSFGAATTTNAQSNKKKIRNHLRKV